MQQVLVHCNNWDSAARQLDMLTSSTQRKETPASVNPGSRRQYAAVMMIAPGISAGLAATKLLHSAPTLAYSYRSPLVPPDR